MGAKGSGRGRNRNKKRDETGRGESEPKMRETRVKLARHFWGLDTREQQNRNVTVKWRDERRSCTMRTIIAYPDRSLCVRCS